MSNVNRELLDKRIDESGLKVGFIAEELGLSRSGFDQKRRGIIPFTVPEKFVLCHLLDITKTEKPLFFSEDVK